MLCISWLVVYKPLLFTKNNNTENIYWDCIGRISNLLNNCLQVSLLLDFVMIQIIFFFNLKNISTVRWISPEVTEYLTEPPNQTEFLLCCVLLLRDFKSLLYLFVNHKNHFSFYPLCINL
jgi:hypothetical protein